jgi:hypothetical protein
MRSSITTVPADRPDAPHSQFTFSSLQVFPVNFQVSIGTGLILTAKKRHRYWSALASPFEEVSCLMTCPLGCCGCPVSRDTGKLSGSSGWRRIWMVS